MNTKELQATVNPCFRTAKAILNILLSSGDPDAIKLSPYLNLSELSESNIENLLPPKMMDCFKIGQMARFDIINSAAMKSGKTTIMIFLVDMQLDASK